MEHRQNQNDVTNRVNVEHPQEVRDAILGIYGARYPGVDFGPLSQAFGDIQALFEGRFPGYLACDTLYHDMRHTLDMTLAMARLIDGHDRVCAQSERLGARRASLGVLVALLHDSGYLKRNSETQVENGAIFTKVHVSRSADFISGYLPRIGFGPEAQVASQLVHFTGYELEIDQIPVHDTKDRCWAAWLAPPTSSARCPTACTWRRCASSSTRNSSGAKWRARSCPTGAKSCATPRPRI